MCWQTELREEIWKNIGIHADWGNKHILIEIYMPCIKVLKWHEMNFNF